MSDAVAIEGLTKIFKVGFIRKRTVLALDNLSPQVHLDADASRA